jgi:hypothetical protein
MVAWNVEIRDARRSVRTHNGVDGEINYACSADRMRLLLRACSMVY